MRSPSANRPVAALGCTYAGLTRPAAPTRSVLVRPGHRALVACELLRRTLDRVVHDVRAFAVDAPRNQ